jgi:uncharacterized membrane protein YvbJ
MMKLEEACVLEVTKLMDYGDSKEDPLTPTVRTHQHHISSTTLQLIMVVIIIVIIIIIIIITKKNEIDKARTRIGENNA